MPGVLDKEWGKRVEKKGQNKRVDSRHRGDRRTLEAQASRILDRCFGDFAGSAPDTVTVEGQTLREHIVTRLQSLYDAGRKRFNPQELTEIRQKWASASTAESCLRVKSNEEVSEALVEALARAGDPCTRKRDVSRLSIFCDTAQKLNQRELGGLLLSCLGKRPSSSPKARQYFLDILDLSARLSLYTKFPDMFAAVRHLFDEALVAEYVAGSKASESPADFIKKNDKRIGVCLPLATFQECVDETKSWTDLARPVQEAISSSRLGDKLFGWCARKTLAAHMAEFMEQLFVPSDGKQFTNQDYNNAYERTLQEAKDMGASGVLQGNRTIQIDFAGVATEQAVSSVEHEFRLRFAAWAKTQRLGKELPLLPFESEYMGAKEPIDIESSMLEKFKEGRLVWRRLLADNESSLASAESIQKHLMQRRHMWASVDKTMHLELEALVALAGESGCSLLRQKVLECFGDQGDLVVTTWWKKTYDLVLTLKNSQVYKYCSRAGQASCDQALDCLYDLTHGLVPRHHGDFMATDYLTKLGEALGKLCAVVVEENGEAKKLVGEAGCKADLARLEKELKENKDVEVEALKLVRCFSYYLGDADKKRLSSLVTNVLEKAEMAIVAVEGQASGSGEAGKNKAEGKRGKGSKEAKELSAATRKRHKAQQEKETKSDKKRKQEVKALFGL